MLGCDVMQAIMCRDLSLNSEWRDPVMNPVPKTRHSGAQVTEMAAAGSGTVRFDDGLFASVKPRELGNFIDLQGSFCPIRDLEGTGSTVRVSETACWGRPTAGMYVHILVDTMPRCRGLDS